MREKLVTVAAGAAILLLAAGALAQQPADWNAQADSLRGKNGQRFDFTCPPGGTPSGRLWGTDLYTDDSSVCTAAVHAGVLSAARGGTVTIEIRPGAPAYKGSARNGLTSGDYGGWAGSFAVVGGQEARGAAGVIRADYTTQANSYRGRNGEQLTFSCPPGGTLSGRLWGSDLYTDDSSICTAAVHAGQLSLARGGTVTIEIRPGAPAYKGSARNGVTSGDYGEWSGSFAFVTGTGNGPVEAAVVTGDWATQADTYRGRNGQRITVGCPPGGTLSGRLWGTDLYTDDSSICTAAVHAGLITVARGGTVTIEIRPGAPAYKGSARNGVTSGDYGEWSGSFAFVTGTGNGPVEAAVVTGDWATQADTYRGRNGQRITVGCPAGGTLSGRLWGTDLYTDDSSICTAAVHAGLITVARGGTVTIEIRPGAPAYKGSARNSATSGDYGGWSGSFVFIPPR